MREDLSDSNQHPRLQALLRPFPRPRLSVMTVLRKLSVDLQSDTLIVRVWSGTVKGYKNKEDTEALPESGCILV